MAKLLCLMLLVVSSFSCFSQITKTDTIKVQLLITTIDTSKTAFLQTPSFARNGYIVIKDSHVVRYLDYFKNPLSPDEIVWDFKGMK